MICLLLGTRPEIIKMSPFISLLEKKKCDYFIVHTNQHFSENMDKQFFDELQLPAPKYNLEIKSRSHPSMISEIIEKTEKIFLRSKPDIVLVQGDTNSVLGGAIVSSKMSIPIGHIEAGLRSYDDTMPEEINRKVTDHLSELLFCPTQIQHDILIHEGFDDKKIFITGNTIVDAVIRNISLSEKTKSQRLENYMLLTLHRPSNVDNETKLKEIIKSISILSGQTGYKIFFPVHPRTFASIEKFDIKMDPSVFMVSQPIGYIEMLHAERGARLILTDSGGIQEEACILKVPCVTLRDNTERPETIEVGANILSGTTTDVLLPRSIQMISSKRNWKNPFGEGDASENILKVLEENNFA